ncbi:MAG: class II glutamine amidotransferase [Polyangiaceae bacterium]|nr:class II glutamine amidotransferase [Polyangiaceae bacterium]
MDDSPHSTHLLGLSFDSPASPGLQLHRPKEETEALQVPGWGIGWYPPDEVASVVVKEPEPRDEESFRSLVDSWQRFRSATFVCHLRGTTKRVNQADAQPFSRTYAGRDWLFAHQGTLNQGELRALSLGFRPVFEPVGLSDSERAFCWLLTQIRAQGCRTIGDLDLLEVRRWLRDLNELGSANFLLSDGMDLLAYADVKGFKNPHYARIVPPHEDIELSNHVLDLDIDNPLDSSRTLTVVATRPLSNSGWKQVPKGELIVVRRGVVLFESSQFPEEQDTAHHIGPSRGFGPMQQPPPGPRGAAGGAPQLAQTRLAESDGAEPTSDRDASGLHRVSSNEEPTDVAPRNAPASVPAPRPEWVTMRVRHLTAYSYEEPVELSSHVLRLSPVQDAEQRLIEHRLVVEPTTPGSDFEDVFGNRSRRMRLEKPYTKLSVLSESIIQVKQPPVLHSPQRRMTIPLVWMPWQRQMMLPYLLPMELPETQLRELSEFAMSFAERQDFDLVETLVDMNQTIYRDFAYVPGSTNIETTPFDVYTKRRGVCQDFANLFICLARLLNIAARYRVGYIYTGADYANQVQSEASHAWVELYLPWTGWRGFDPTNGILAGTDHIRVACGRNYRDATPTSGTLYKGGGGERLKVSVRVEPIDLPE